MSLETVCEELGLTAMQCSTLKGKLPSLCSIAPSKTKRKRSLWQQCIATRRKGKPFDPQAIKKLAEEYRAGKCP
jgi:hypothetical protein